ncbi:MAG: 50S ribosomal protein L29 [Opitutales bacterium]|nr:50S ribosomal protein L29 [Opitutales bacterium]
MAEKTKDLRELSLNELDKKLRDLRQELLQSRLNKRTGQLERTHLLRELRHDIARVRTVLNEKKKAVPAA